MDILWKTSFNFETVILIDLQTYMIQLVSFHGIRNFMHVATKVNITDGYEYYVYRS